MDETERAQKQSELAARIGAATKPSRPAVWFGSRGSDVEFLQRRLQKLKIYSIKEGDDVGLFGRATERALRAFQSANGLREDAVCGPKTWEVLGD